MKLSRTLTALALAAAVSCTWTMAAHASAPVWGAVGLKRHVPQSPTLPKASPQAPAESGGEASSPTTTSAPAADRVIVDFKDSATPSVLSATARSADTSSGTVSRLSHDQYTWHVPRGRSATEFAAELQESDHVEYAVPDYERKLVAYTPPAYVSPNDPDFTNQNDGTSYIGSRLIGTYKPGRSWWLREIAAPTAWEQAYTGPDIIGKYPLRASGEQITVAVIDSGLYDAHPEIGANVVGGHDFFEREPYPGGKLVEDDDVKPVPVSSVVGYTVDDPAPGVLTASHGTCVSGEIGATANNGIGSVGVGYDTRVIVHKVMGISSSGVATIYDSAVIAAIIHSVDIDHAKVINLSLGGYNNSPAIANAINYAYSKGCIIVAAKGNDKSARAFYPASNKHVISVGALDKNAAGGTIPASFTNYAKTSLDIMAPGSFIWGLSSPNFSLDINGLNGSHYGYFLWDGTSMAAPMVSGAVAWLWRTAPALSNAEITSEVLGSAPKGPASTHFPSGYRKINMATAYARLKADYPLLPKPVLAEQTVAALGPVPVTCTIPLAKLRGVTYTWSDQGVQVGQGSVPRIEFNWDSGDHLIGVRASSAYNWDDHTAYSETLVHAVPVTAGATNWLGAHLAGSSATIAPPAYHAATAIDATLHDASGTALCGANVTLQSSTDNVHFTSRPKAVVMNLQSGVYRASATPTSRTWYRFSFSGAESVARSVSPSMRVVPGVSLSTPSSKSSISHTAKLSVTGKLMPSHSTSSRVVKIKIKRWNGHRWADYSWTWARVTRRNSTYSAYAAAFKLKKGGYRLYAYAPADSLHSATTSGYRSVTVK